MFRKVLLFLFVFVVAASGCDSCGKKEDPFDAAWNRVQPLVINAASDAERVRILQGFIQEHQGHPRLPEIQAQLDALQTNVKVEVEKKEEVKRQTEAEKKANAVKVYESFSKENDWDSLIYFSIAGLIWRGGGSKTFNAVETVNFKDVTGEERRFEGNKMFLPITLRGGFIGRLRYVDENIDHKCRLTCQNDLINKFLTPFIGEGLYDENQAIKKAALEKLLKKVDLGVEVGGASIADLYRLMGPSIDQALIVREGIRKRGDDASLVAFRIAKKEGRQTLKKWYKAYPNETGIEEEVPEATRRRVDLTLGFWMRRINEGNADLIEQFLKDIKSAAEEG